MAPGAVGGAHEDVLEDRHRLERMWNLVSQRDARAAARVCRRRGDVPAVEQYRAAIGAQTSGHDVERGRLARAVWADDADRLTLAHRESEAIENLEPTERARDLLEREQSRRAMPA